MVAGGCWLTGRSSWAGDPGGVRQTTKDTDWAVEPIARSSVGQLGKQQCEDLKGLDEGHGKRHGKVYNRG